MCPTRRLARCRIVHSLSLGDLSLPLALFGCSSQRNCVSCYKLSAMSFGLGKWAMSPFPLPLSIIVRHCSFSGICQSSYMPFWLPFSVSCLLLCNSLLILFLVALLHKVRSDQGQPVRLEPKLVEPRRGAKPGLNQILVLSIAVMRGEVRRNAKAEAA